MDVLSKDQRHKNMAAIHSANTKPEMIVRKYLFAHGFRYRLNHPRLPGRPDIVLRKYRTCIFINGCFWHGHDITSFPNRTRSSGHEKSHATSSVTSGYSRNWHEWGGTA